MVVVVIDITSGAVGWRYTYYMVAVILILWCSWVALHLLRGLAVLLIPCAFGFKLNVIGNEYISTLVWGLR